MAHHELCSLLELSRVLSRVALELVHRAYYAPDGEQSAPVLSCSWQPISYAA
jgi:hypothetical protein